MLARMILNSWSQVILLHRPPKVLGFFIFYFLFFFWDRVSLCHPDWSTVITVSTHCNLCLQGSRDSPALVSWVAGITGVCHHTLRTFYIFGRDGFHHAGQAGLKLLTSSDPPSSTFQSAGITSVSHCTWLVCFDLFIFLSKLWVRVGLQLGLWGGGII